MPSGRSARFTRTTDWSNRKSSAAGWKKSPTDSTRSNCSSPLRRIDAGRKVEVLRKRALINGGGLGQAPLGQIYRGWYAGPDLHRHADRTQRRLQELRSGVVRVGVRVGADPRSNATSSPAPRNRLSPTPRLRAGPPRVVRPATSLRPRSRLTIQFLRAEASMVQEMRLSTTESARRSSCSAGRWR